MTNRRGTILTLTPDFNVPPRGEDGARIEVVWSRWIIEDIKSGEIAAGDPVFLYFDPEGKDRFEYECGYGISGKIIHVEVKNSPHSGEELGWITYVDDL